MPGRTFQRALTAAALASAVVVGTSGCLVARDGYDRGGYGSPRVDDREERRERDEERRGDRWRYNHEGDRHGDFDDRARREGY